MRLAIVGGGNTVKDAPFDNPLYDIWTTASIAKTLPRVTTIFEFHSGEGLQDPSVYAKASEVIYTSDFPIGQMVAHYGKIFPSSMNLIMAYAIDKGYKHIELYGVDMALDSEYERFRPSFLYLIGYARGAGITVEISEGSVLMADEKTYCYERDIVRERIEKMRQDRASFTNTAREYELKAEYMRGAIDAAGFFSKI
jgi:hypothetical protein